MKVLGEVAVASLCCCSNVQLEMFNWLRQTAPASPGSFTLHTLNVVCHTAIHCASAHVCTCLHTWCWEQNME